MGVHLGGGSPGQPENPVAAGQGRPPSAAAAAAGGVTPPRPRLLLAGEVDSTCAHVSSAEKYVVKNEKCFLLPQESEA